MSAPLLDVARQPFLSRLKIDRLLSLVVDASEAYTVTLLKSGPRV